MRARWRRLVTHLHAVGHGAQIEPFHERKHWLYPCHMTHEVQHDHDAMEVVWRTITPPQHVHIGITDGSSSLLGTVQTKAPLASSRSPACPTELRVPSHTG